MGKDKDDKDGKEYTPRHAGERKKDVPLEPKRPTGPEWNGKGGKRS
ncbi:hypothetical protein [Nonomuraea candida]|nr:hypothetical protein [Nonomuraea candida]